MSQFVFLRSEFAPVFSHAQKAENLALSDPRGACFYARLSLETAIKWMYESDPSLRTPYDHALSALIHEPSFRKLVGNALVTKAKLIKDLGNRAVHDSHKKISEQSSITSLRELFHFSYWLVRTYAKGAKPAADIQFDSNGLQNTLTITASTVQQIKKMREDFDAREKALEQEQAARLATEAEREKLNEEIKRLQAEIAATKKANQAAPDTHDYNEEKTRDAFIDLLLHEAGWPLDQERDREFPVFGMPNSTGEGFVDYVLWGNDGKPLGLVEAKRTKKDSRVGQQQAKLYADCLEEQLGQRPVIFLSNGYEHWLWDDTRYPPRPVQGFYKKAELELLHQRRSSRKNLTKVKIDTDIVERFYQTRAIRRVGEAFEKDHLRKSLLVMATGSGKTRTVIALTDQLMRANWVKRVLFLADRIALVNQAHAAFKSHLPSAPSANLLQKHDPKKNDHNGARICLATYPTMMGLINEVEDGARRFGPGHFDLVVIDEAHRSVYRKYRAIFEYFDSFLVGLTATPRDEIDRDTYSLFELEKGVPTDSYDLDEAVADGFLVPPRAVSVPLKFQREGINYDDLSEEEKEAWDALEWTEDGEERPDRVEASDLNKWLFNTDTVDKVLEHLMTNGLKVEEGDRLGKSIIFAKNSKHARFIAERFDKNYPHLKGQFAQVIDYSVDYAQSLIDDFSDPKKPPHIAISVDMLDTGIDVPEVVNLVFFKIVRSKTKFWQMIGRGTRLCPDLFGPDMHKENFLVFDFCQNFEFFNQNPKASDGALAPSISEKLFVARVDLMDEIAKSEEGADVELVDLKDSIEQRLFDEVIGMNVDNFIVRPKRRYVEKYQARAAWSDLSIENRLELTEHIAGLPSSLKDDELEAKQFDYLVLLAQLALLRSDVTLAKFQKRIQEIASSLEELGNVPMVAAQMNLILELQTDEYWEDVTLPMLEEVRRKLRSLVKLIEPASRKIVYTDFQDEIGEGSDVVLPDIGNGTDKARFMMKVRHFLEQHGEHIVLQKLRRNEQLTSQDIGELERIFLEEGVVEDTELSRIRGEGGLGLFIRSLVGLDREAAKKAFSNFLDGKVLSSNQIEFVDLIIDHLTERGAMDPRRLYESPFTDIDDQGVSGVFEIGQVKALVQVLKDVTARAVA
ncbi:restriction endonuclease subunit R [Kiloniella litopenaei]|uniref:Restriction endonuclease subunit R n=1 Tax=Kiloniella litopenaei TaxID=1549748 RepID=A0A0M2R5B1_9PROT|nr:DEAD/DEAH box helicase family protein [Kiloniella litopenaei]KKJ75634.1 restriction endonuclease subunit R [Kiloniella litopenaei]